MDKHTETKWKLHCLGSEGYTIFPVHSKTLTEMKAESKTQDEFYDKVHPIARLEGNFYRQKANAEFIVKAVNNHEALVEALKAVYSTAICNGDMSISFAVDGKVRKQMELALANIEEK